MVPGSSELVFCGGEVIALIAIEGETFSCFSAGGKLERTKLLSLDL